MISVGPLSKLCTQIDLDGIAEAADQLDEIMYE